MLKKTFVFFLCLGLLVSCVDDLDFNQVDDLQLTPTYEASILYFQSPEDVINDTTDAEFFVKNFEFEAFSSDVFADRVIDGVITYVVENTTSKELELKVEFLNDAGFVTDIERFRMPPQPTAMLQREIVYGSSGKNIDILKTLTTIRITSRNLSDNTSVSAASNPTVSVKTSGKFRVRLK